MPKLLVGRGRYYLLPAAELIKHQSGADASVDLHYNVLDIHDNTKLPKLFYKLNQLASHDYVQKKHPAHMDQGNQFLYDEIKAEERCNTLQYAAIRCNTELFAE